MGKQAKKKQKTDGQGKTQKNHNRATRGVNTKRRACVWETRQENCKDKDGNPAVKTVKVTYPNNTQWDWTLLYDAVPDEEGVTRLMRRKPEKQKPLPAPFNELLNDNWDEDLAQYAEEQHAGIDKSSIGGGRFRFEVFREEYDRQTGKNRKKVLLTMDSPRNTYVPKSKKGFRKKR